MEELHDEERKQEGKCKLKTIPQCKFSEPQSVNAPYWKFLRQFLRNEQKIESPSSLNGSETFPFQAVGDFGNFFTPKIVKILKGAGIVAKPFGLVLLSVSHIFCRFPTLLPSPPHLSSPFSPGW